MSVRCTTPNAAIRAEDLRLVLQAEKLRRHTRGRTCRLCALTDAPWLQTSCAENTHRLALADPLYRKPSATRSPRVQPMQRGHIASLIGITRQRRGLAEVRRTWGAGLRALLAEPHHILHGGQS
jgi:hypothetical protein